MKALQLIEIGKPLVERDIPTPVPQDTDVLIRVKAAGICHTDEHYRTGDVPVADLPLILGHEVAGIVEKSGKAATRFSPGNRVCVHYLATCGDCCFCRSGNEQFCPSAQMIGKHRSGGYAEFLLMPSASVVALPEGVSFPAGAVMMCSTSTAFHALRKGRMRAGERVAVFGAGGLGISAIQLALIMGAAEVFAVDIRKEKLQVAKKHGAIAIDAHAADPALRIRELTHGKGVDVALEMAGRAETSKQALACMAKLGRLVLVGLCDQPFSVRAYSDILGNETEIIGCSDHLLSELPVVLEFARQGRIDFSDIVARTIPLQADPVNDALEALHLHQGAVRTVIVP